jgi:hypothetical protein
MHQRSAHRSLLVVGSVAFDDIDGPFGLHKDLLGGSASFITRTAAYFTRNVSVVAVIGEDFPAKYLDEMTAAGIDIGGIERAKGETFHWVGKYAPDLATRETIDTRLGVFADFRPKLNDTHRDAQLVLPGNIDPVLQLEVLEQVRRPSLVATDTMNLWINIKRADPRACHEDQHADAQRRGGLVCPRASTTWVPGRCGTSSSSAELGDHRAMATRRAADPRWRVFAAPAMPLADVKDPTGAATACGRAVGHCICGRPITDHDPHRDDRGQRDGSRGRAVLGRRAAS